MVVESSQETITIVEVTSYDKPRQGIILSDSSNSGVRAVENINNISQDRPLDRIGSESENGNHESYDDHPGLRRG